jgi:hypothetical protein
MKLASVSPVGVIVPRVTQMQQILSVDIIFVKNVAFLLGRLIPFGLGLVRYLRDRSVAKVGSTIQLMFTKPTSRYVDVIELRCDGE